VYRAPVVVGAVKQSLEAAFDIVHHSAARGFEAIKAFEEVLRADDAEVSSYPRIWFSRTKNGSVE
jgi:hypothetical protein